MELSRMKVLPNRAGLAELRFTETAENRQLPYRNGAEIVLSNSPHSAFYPLKAGEQFLVHCQTGIWFGGTDEQPFLTHLDSEPFKAFLQGGEQDFYEALKPQLVRELERQLGVTTKRQGDIFAVPLPFSWDDIKRFASLAFIAAPFIGLGGEFMQRLHMWRGSIGPRKGRVFGTRHRILATCATSEQNIKMFIGETNFIGHKQYLLAEGLLAAPDHSPLTLTGVHTLVQADGLFDPKRAD